MLARQLPVTRQVSVCDLQDVTVHWTGDGLSESAYHRLFQVPSQTLGSSLPPIAADTREMRQTFHFTRLPHKLVARVLSASPFPISHLSRRSQVHS